MTRRPPTSTFFPYTTLFRSYLQSAHFAGFIDRCRPSMVQGQDRRGSKRNGQDRKSTRLNSSHLVISYAVFCLKKKKLRELTHGEGRDRGTKEATNGPNREHD